MSISLNIPTIDELSTGHVVAVIVITMITVVTTIAINEFVSALKRFWSNRDSGKIDKAKGTKYSKILREDIVTILVYSFWVWFIVKGDEPVSYFGVMGIVVLTILILIALFTSLFHYVRYQNEKKEKL